MSDSGDMITVTGNVATEPELKRTSAGVAITTLRVASGRRKYDRDSGTWSDAGTNWYTVSVFRALAEHAFHSLHKGDRVILSGRLRVRDWDNGTRRGTAVEIDAEAIGHDLRWGTTTFVKDGRANGGETAANWAAEGSGDTWAAPGVDAASTPGSEGAASDHADRPPAAVGAEARPDAELAETPF